MKKLYLFLFAAFLSQYALAQTNTFPASGNVGIGTTTPNSKLTVVGDTWTDGLKNTDAYFEKVLPIPSFPNLAPNLGVDLRLGNLCISGYIEVEITGFYNYAPAMGKLTKIFAVGTNPGGSIYTNESRVSDAIGTISNEISIGEFSWDEGSSTFKIPISHISSAQNTFSVKIKVFSHYGSASQVHNAIALSSQYTMPALSRNYVNFNGNVGIGTSTPTERLSVNGKIRAQEIKVETINWPDYVFEETFKPLSLADLESYIKINKHLPGIPSAKEVILNGINLGEMNAKLLKKIEEQTLYIIEQDKKLEHIMKRVEDLESEKNKN
jgi:hypothetical protein